MNGVCPANFDDDLEPFKPEFGIPDYPADEDNMWDDEDNLWEDEEEEHDPSEEEEEIDTSGRALDVGIYGDPD